MVGNIAVLGGVCDKYEFGPGGGAIGTVVGAGRISGKGKFSCAVMVGLSTHSDLQLPVVELPVALPRGLGPQSTPVQNVPSHVSIASSHTLSSAGTLPIVPQGRIGYVTVMSPNQHKLEVQVQT
eukprot:3242711-Amphidinium_carterae.1